MLSRNWRDTRDGLRLEFWLATQDGPFQVILTGEQAVMFVPRVAQTSGYRRREVALKNLAEQAVDALYFPSQRALNDARARLLEQSVFPLEADVKPSERFLMERFITGGMQVHGCLTEQGGIRSMVNPRVASCDYSPSLSLLSFDIETDGFDGPLLSIAGCTKEASHVFMKGSGESDADLSYCQDERQLLRAFFDWVGDLDPDLLIGWNVVEFDLKYLEDLCRRLNMPLALGRGGRKLDLLAPRNPQQPWVCRAPGRVVLDGIATLRSATWRFESFSLDNVAQELLGRGKQVHDVDNRVDEIRRMFRQDKAALAAYNLEDCRLVLDIFAEAKLLEFAIERQQLTGLPLDRQGGSVAAFDHLYLPRLHRAGFVAPSVGDGPEYAPSPGGYVMDSAPGLYKNVLVLDFKSLYPSIIRTFLIDPLALAIPGEDPVEGFDGARFSRQHQILPGLIETLWTARDRAKREQNTAMSQAIKILMNSFYGVLGTPGCRFFNAQLASSITRRGHQILTDTRTFIQQRGLEVIYGDTDSVFVHLKEDLDEAACDQVGQRLAAELNDYWQARIKDEFRLPCALEVEYETHFLRFLMPTMRGSDKGTKKRYAGLVRAADGSKKVVFKGLEAVRTDWTRLARAVQRELYQRVFLDQEYKDYLVAVGQDLRDGKLDDQLVYRKRIRRKLEDYVKNVPPHIQAARKLDRVGRTIEYVITINGPEPVSLQTSRLDYDHYLERQLAPATDGILHFLGTDFMALGGAQPTLF